MSDVEETLRAYREASAAVERTREERDAMGIFSTNLDDPQNLFRQDDDARRRWDELDREMWRLRAQQSRAWAAYARAVSKAG